MTDIPREPFAFSEPHEPETREERRARVVHEAIGAASTCWAMIEFAGAFDSSRARQIAEALLAELDALSTTTVGPLSLTSPGGSCRVGGEPHDHPDTRQDHDHRRAALLADDLERDPTRARARTNAETVDTVRRALRVLEARRLLASSDLTRITDARNALLKVKITE